ncbi:Apoptotic ATPase [Handroanthus impetiginosus]|uniref:Apoptotic ATPase n=1 Tax=Handroanthus impetiginosus TaxID=429701 RepID=A0A2G9H646_9LAMI|nr:Apoptotic ATPase [Handroanthus impetiginosus]
MVINLFYFYFFLTQTTLIKMLKQIMESFFSKVGDKLVEYGFDTLRDEMNSKSTFEAMRNNLNSLSDKAFDVEKTIEKAEQSGKKKRKREVEKWLEQVKMIENQIRTLEREVQTEGFLRKFLTGDQVTQLSTSVNKLVEQSRHFGELLVDGYKTRGELLLTTKLSGKMFKENLERIEKFLESDKSSIGIYGMGGAGKTSLAKHINNIILEKYQENRVCWITVSQDFSIKKLQDEIAHFVGLDLFDEDNEDKRAARLNRAIGNNFILILDDVWAKIYLEKLGDPLRLEGCRLILTTRSLEVCCRMGCQEKVKVEKLLTNEAWDLFKQIIEQDIALAPEIEEIAKNMAKVCDGLPLGIIVLAGSMRGETSIHVWRNELEKLRDPNMVQEDMEDEVFKVLKYSLHRLDLNHQLCFLYCSLYGEDFKIEKEELIKRFISEELVDIRKSRLSQFDQGHSILNKLVKVCLLESVDHFSVKMHDLVRSMALKITKGKNMVFSKLYLKEIPNEGEWIRDLEKVSLMNNSMIEIPDGMSSACPKLATLILSRNPLKFIPNSFFSKLVNLCFLDLSGTDIEKLPNSLSNLENLKALNLQGCQHLVDIPDLGRLKKLRELDLSDTRIEKVPQGMEELANLRFLSLIFAGSLKTLPEGLFLNFPLLQCLRLPCHIEAPIEEILRLKHLEQFRGGMKNVSNFCKFNRCRQSQLTCFMIHVNRGDDDFKNGMNKGDDHYKIWRWTSENHVNEVVLFQCDLKNEEEEDFSMLFHDNKCLELRNCEGVRNFLLTDFLKSNMPSSLETLVISRCGGMECFLTNERFLTTSRELDSRFFPLRTLTSIRLIELENFVGLIQNVGVAVEPPLPQEAVFSSLRFLTIARCHKMRELGLPLLEFQNLENICISECGKIEEIIKVREGEGRVVSLPKLTWLELRDLPRLKSICNTTLSCSSIVAIHLQRCRELKKLPLHFDLTSPSPPQTLKYIWMYEEDKEWWESLEWEHPTHSHLLQPLVIFFGGWKYPIL